MPHKIHPLTELVHGRSRRNLHVFGAALALAAVLTLVAYLLTPAQNRTALAYVECSSTVAGSLFGTSPVTNQDNFGQGPHDVDFTPQFQKLIDATDGTYCGKIRAHTVLLCNDTSTCKNMDIGAAIWDGTTLHGTQHKLVSSLTAHSTNTVYSDWVTCTTASCFSQTLSTILAFGSFEDDHGNAYYDQCDVDEYGTQSHCEKV